MVAGVRPGTAAPGVGMSTAKVLLIATSAETVEAYRGLASSLGVEPTVVGSLRAAAKRLAGGVLDAVFVQMDGAEGRIRERVGEGFAFTQQPPTIAVTCEPSIRDAVAALRAGAREYLGSPPQSAEDLGRLLQRVRTSLPLRRAGVSTPQPGFFAPLDGFLTRDRRMLTAFKTVAGAAHSRVPMVLRGESGTGKSSLARALHKISPRRFAPMVEFKCAGPPEPLVEAELFGGEVEGDPPERCQRNGRFEQADGGTLALDGVEELSPALRRRIVSAAESGEFRRSSDGTERSADVRLVLTAEPSPGDPLGGGPFDGVRPVRLELPPLRDRVGDIPLLAEHFLKVYANRYRRPVAGFHPEALTTLAHYSWPGNVTELKNAVEHGVILADDGRISAECLPSSIREDADSPQRGQTALELLPLKAAMRDPERRYILRALEESGWNKQHAARELNISRSTLYKKLREYGLNEAGQALRGA